MAKRCCLSTSQPHLKCSITQCCSLMQILKALRLIGRRLANLLPPPSVVSCPKPTIHKTVVDIGAGKDFVIIDGAPRVTDLARSCIMASDLVLIPVQPSPYDIWASQEVVSLIQEAVIYKPGIKVAFVINRKIPNTAIGRDIESALAEFELPVLSTTIGQRVIFAESAASGLSVLEQDAKSQATAEISSFAKDVLNLLEKK